MPYNVAIANLFDRYMTDKDIKYTFDKNRGIFTAQYTVSRDDLIGHVTLKVVVGDEEFEVRAIAPVNAPKNKRDDLAILLTHINYPIKNGCFRLDYSDGEISFELYNSCRKQLPTVEDIEYCFRTPLRMFNRYGKQIGQLLAGQKTVDELTYAVDHEDDDIEGKLDAIRALARELGIDLDDDDDD